MLLFLFPLERRQKIANLLLFSLLLSSELERDDRGGDQPDIDLAGAEPADGGHLLLHHGPLRPPRLLRHLLRTATQREFWDRLLKTGEKSNRFSSCVTVRRSNCAHSLGPSKRPPILGQLCSNFARNLNYERKSASGSWTKSFPGLITDGAMNVKRELWRDLCC